jgi:hypothetical protein
VYVGLSGFAVKGNRWVMVNVICIKWGTRYGADYVNKLYHMVRRNITRDFRFVCLTDDSSGVEPTVEILPIPDLFVPAKKAVSPWRKLVLFSPKLGDLSGKTLFLDLDVAIVDNIDAFFDFSEKFTIIENWSQKGQGVGNSSVYCFEIGQHTEVLSYYETHHDEVLKKYKNEQIYLSKKIGDIAYWPSSWCQSFKYGAIPAWPMRLWQTPQLPPGCKILVFHGHPNPDEAIVGDYGRKWRKYFRSAPWILDYWH